MSGYKVAKQVGERGNRMVVYATECVKDGSGFLSAISFAADPNDSDDDRSCIVRIRLDGAYCFLEVEFRQLGRKSTEKPRYIYQANQLVGIVIGADGTEVKPDDYEGNN